MKFVVIGLKKHYHIQRLREEAEKLGNYTVEGILPKQLMIYMSEDKAKYRLRNYNGRLRDISLIYPWTISHRRKWDWFMFLKYMNKKFNTQIVYDKYVDEAYQVYLTPTSDYAKQVKAKVPFPRSIVLFGQKSITRAIKDFDLPVILKVNAPRMSRQGKGVYLINSTKELTDIVNEYEDVADRFILREFIPNDGDIRIFIVGYKAVAGMYRHPKKGDFRSNISQGGTAEPFDLSKNSKIVKLAEKVARLTRTEIAGVDIMLHKYSKRPYVLEVNSGPQFQGLETLTGVNIAKSIIKYFIKKSKGKNLFGWK